MDANRRQYQRLRKKFRVEISEFRYPPAEQPAVSTHCRDISQGGLRVESPRSFQAGEKIQLTIYISGLNKFHPSYFKVFESDVGQHLVAVAEVAWIDEKAPLTLYDMGLKFVDVWEDDWKALAAMIKKQLG